MRTTISWGDGTGDNIYLDYTEASGSQTILVSSDANTGFEPRTKIITFSASGATPATLTVTQAEGSDLISITFNDVCITYDNVGLGYAKRLPEGYTELQYVTMTSYIDTGYKTKNTSRIEGKIYCNQSSSAYLWRSDSSSSGSTNTTAYYSSSGNWRFGNRTFAIAAHSVLMGDVHEVVQDSSGVTIDGTSAGTYSSVGTFTSSANLQFGSSSSSVSIRHYYFRHYIDGEIVTDMIPVKNASNVAGFWDFVSGAFFAGGTAGPAKE